MDDASRESAALLELAESVVCGLESASGELGPWQPTSAQAERAILGAIADAQELRRRVLRLTEVVKEAGEQDGRTESWEVYKNGVHAVLKGARNERSDG